jgi:adenylate cyclase
MSWASPGGNGSVMPQSALFNSFYNDSDENIAQLSPGFGRPGSGRDESMGFPSDERRPSVATVSSQGSSLGSRFHKPLQRFFGDEYPGDSRQNSDTSLATPYTVESQPTRPGRNRNNSVNNTLSGSLHSRPGSPVGTRPHTPLPSSEVTPWEFQDFKVSSKQGCTWRIGFRKNLFALPPLFPPSPFVTCVVLICTYRPCI